MKEIIIYEYQLNVIYEALRLTSNIHESSKGKTCFDRQVRQAKKFAENALADKKDEYVPYEK
jgi:hypothetical protein